ncbi:hypothetical protein D3C80_1302230 [compost metagenome]
MDLQIGLPRDIAFAVVLVGADGDIAVHLVAFLHRSLHPGFERLNLQLFGTPTGLRRWQEVLVFLEPEIEVSFRIEPFDRLAEKALEATEEFINFRQFLAGVGEEILDIQLRMLLAHVDGQGGTVSPPRDS